MNEYGLVVLNGRSQNDVNGEFTFCSTVGTSINDIVAISNDIIHLCTIFTVNCKHWSDHMPLEFGMELKNVKRITSQTRCPKVKYKSTENYQKKLTENTSKINTSSVDLQNLKCHLKK